MTTATYPRTLTCTHCRGRLLVRELDDTFTCLTCGRAARAALVSRDPARAVRAA